MTDQYHCVFEVRRDFGPWRRGWFVGLDLRRADVPVVALLDRHDADSLVGAWGPEARPRIFDGIAARALLMVGHSPDLGVMGAEQLLRSTDFSDAILKAS